jgi:hypothetical protein
VKVTLALITAASALFLAACGSSTTSYGDFKAHTQSTQAAAAGAGFGPGWTEEQARAYAAAEVDWLQAHQPERCYTPLHGDMISFFQAHANGNFKALPPPGFMQHAEEAEASCREP